MARLHKKGRNGFRLKKGYRKYLYLFTIAFFVLGFVNILFAYSGFVCMVVPFILLFRDKQKTWCQKYCPRAHMFHAVCPVQGLRPTKFFAGGWGKWAMLVYFLISLATIALSTVMVATGKAPGQHSISLFMTVPLPNMAQLLSIPVSEWILHLAYKLYAMMLSMTVLGIAIGVVYKPRTWCAICPISTVSGEISKKISA